MKASPDPAVLPIELEEHLLRWCPDPLPGLGIRRLASSPVDVRLFFPSALRQYAASPKRTRKPLDKRVASQNSSPGLSYAASMRNAAARISGAGNSILVKPRRAARNHEIGSPTDPFATASSRRRRK
jgi:hypothetical protein